MQRTRLISFVAAAGLTTLLLAGCATATVVETTTPAPTPTAEPTPEAPAAPVAFLDAECADLVSADALDAAFGAGMSEAALDSVDTHAVGVGRNLPVTLHAAALVRDGALLCRWTDGIDHSRALVVTVSPTTQVEALTGLEFPMVEDAELAGASAQCVGYEYMYELDQEVRWCAWVAGGDDFSMTAAFWNPLESSVGEPEANEFEPSAQPLPIAEDAPARSVVTEVLTAAAAADRVPRLFEYDPLADVACADVLEGGEEPGQGRDQQLALVRDWTSEIGLVCHAAELETDDLIVDVIIVPGMAWLQDDPRLAEWVVEDDAEPVAELGDHAEYLFLPSTESGAEGYLSWFVGDSLVVMRTVLGYDDEPTLDEQIATAQEITASLG